MSDFYKKAIINHLKLINSCIFQFEKQYCKSFDLSDAIALNNYRVQKDLLEDILRTIHNPENWLNQENESENADE